MGRYSAGTQERHSQQFTASGFFTVPDRFVPGTLRVTGVASGGGACSGSVIWAATATHGSVGDYACGGGGGQACSQRPIIASAGDLITVTVGAAGTGGASVSRSTAGSTTGNPGSDAANLSLTRPGVVLLFLRRGLGGTWATGGGGAGGTADAADGVINGGDGGDDVAIAQGLGASLAGAEGANDSTPGAEVYGGHSGGPTAFGNGGDGGDADDQTSADATGGAGSDGIYGGGGGGGGGAGIGTGTTETATSGAGGNGGTGFVIFEWLESV